jgi:hypothetical protein
MTHDPNVLNVLSYSLDGRLFKLRADRLGTLFVSVLCVFYVFEKTGWRSGAVRVSSCRTCTKALISITRALRFTDG